MQINALSLSHNFIRERVPSGGLCIDATAGRGKDTALLCDLVGEAGRVLSFDIQREALESTRFLLEDRKLLHRAHLILDSHDNMAAYAEPSTVDCIVFNFGWLPGGNHDIHTRTESSIRAIRQGLTLLKPEAVMSLCIYYGRNNGYEERDAILSLLEELDSSHYTAVVSRFVNRKGDVAIPVFIYNQG